jgi:hypothetical protein
MKLIIKDNRIAATATDEYVTYGDEQAVLDAPADFDISRIADYVYTGGVLAIAPKPLTHVELMDRFTDAELAAIYVAAKQNVAVEIWLDKFRLSSEIDPKDPRTVSGMELLETAGLIAQGRAAEILA